MADCDARSPLVHSGTTQTDRDLGELAVPYFRIDERELADLVLYAQALSREVRYYAPDNTPGETWEAFFASDITATLATLARLPVEAFRTAAADAEEFLKGEPPRPEADLRAYFNLLFHLPVALFGEMARTLQRLPRDHALHGQLQRLVETELMRPLTALLRFYKGAIGAGLPLGTPEPALDPNEFGTGTAADPRPRLSATVAGPVFVPEALTQRQIGIGSANWSAFAAIVTGDSSPYQQAPPGPNQTYEQIYDALTYNLLVAQFEAIYQGLQRARDAAGAALEASLTQVDDHTPHYGLFLAFLEMLGVARQALNGLTARHLDFYYREILRLAPRAPVPASVHVLFELAKGTGAHLLESGTALRAGKDGQGNDVFYELADDFIVNRGEVGELRAVRVHSKTSGGDLYQTVFASPVADSPDGLGADLEDPARGWRPFGPLPFPSAATEPKAPFARIGFAVADRRLFLREGAREIYLAFELEAPLPALLLAGMRVRLTAPDGWKTVNGTLFGPLFVANGLIAQVLLDGDHPPVVPYDVSVHVEEDGASYPPGLPVAEFTFAFAAETDSTARAFALLRQARITNSYLQTSATGLRSLSLLTPDGAGDPAKPFKPFGAQPKTGASLVIGSAEIFAKQIDSLRLNITWEETYSSSAYFLKTGASSYTCDVSYLRQGSWSQSPTDLDLKLTENTPTLYLPSEDLADSGTAMALEESSYGPKARGGFMRLSLNTDFGHAEYPAEFTRTTIQMARGTTVTEDTNYNYLNDPDGNKTTPKPPFLPVIKEISASYTSAADAPAHFFHVAPFGQAERASEAEALLPPLDYEAALFIGVKNFDSPARLSLLAQVANGSGDPLLEVPQLAFHYLDGNSWQGFAEKDVDDKTENLQASAVLGLAMPKEADTAHALMPDGMHWVRLSTAANAAAVNSLLAVKAQAARAVFNDQKNDPQYLATPLPAGTIGKLKTPERQVKKVFQPYSSFGGRPEENLASFRRRSAERLRHKDRAATLWDYERLALEAAPELYRVKCLNHTELMRESGKIVADNELKAGSVVVVTVPWTIGRPHLDPLRPYSDTATRKKVKDVLASRLSPFIKLEVANPKFEEVQAQFKVAFRAAVADTAFYKSELEKAVIGYLAPWSVGAGADITFGGVLRKSSVIDFVEELPYVDYLEDFELFHIPDPESAPTSLADKEIIEATTARSILVSATGHSIEEIVLP